jgi:hypothetical protein
VDLFAEDETCGLRLIDIIAERLVSTVNETPGSRSFTCRMGTVFVILVAISI